MPVQPQAFSQEQGMAVGPSGAGYFIPNNPETVFNQMDQTQQPTEAAETQGPIFTVSPPQQKLAVTRQAAVNPSYVQSEPRGAPNAATIASMNKNSNLPQGAKPIKLSKQQQSASQATANSQATNQVASSVTN